MKRTIGLLASWFAFTLTGCDSTTEIPHDLSTPEGAILCLEDAYRAKDIDAAVRCKDFTVEATLMLQQLQQDFSGDKDILTQTAEVLELGFRSELTNKGFPDFRNVASTFSDTKPYQSHDDIVQLNETCKYTDGTITKNTLTVAKTGDGWKVVSIVE